MPRKTSRVAEAVAETGQLTRDLTDEEIMAAIQAETAANAARLAPPPAPRQISLQTLFDEMLALVHAASGRGRRPLTEQSAVKVLELSLMWALNTRNAPQPVLDIPTQEIGGSGEPEKGPAPNEEIGFDTSGTDESADEETAA